MPSCTTYVADPSFQLAPAAGPTGSVDCSAHATSDVIDAATCGAKDPGGRAIRLLSSEPVPDPRSPGLNLVQAAQVALDDFGVYLDVRIGSRSVPWPEYEKRRKDGQPSLLQVDYRAIAYSVYDAGRGFGKQGRAGHAFAETTHASYDPLADGRPGAFKFNGTLYTRTLMQTAAAGLVINDAGTHPRPGTVWAAFAADVVPDYIARVPVLPGQKYRKLANYTVEKVGGTLRITGFKADRTKGIRDDCTPPRWVRKPDVNGKHGGYRELVQLLTGAREGDWVWSGWAVKAA